MVDVFNLILADWSYRISIVFHLASTTRWPLLGMTSGFDDIIFNSLKIAYNTISFSFCHSFLPNNTLPHFIFSFLFLFTPKTTTQPKLQYFFGSSPTKKKNLICPGLIFKSIREVDRYVIRWYITKSNAPLV